MAGSAYKAWSGSLEEIIAGRLPKRPLSMVNKHMPSNICQKEIPL